MKRKLEELEKSVSEPVVNTEKSPEPSFGDFGLDPRLLSAVAQQKFHKPTRVQQEAIPLALNGRDVLAKSKTGSGKTLAYLLPILQHVLRRKQTDSSAATTTLILTPTHELADQVTRVISQLTAFCSQDIQAVKLTDSVSDDVHRSLLSSSPDIVVSTPSKAWRNINASFLSLEKVSHLVLDEADLVLSYGYEEDLERVSKLLPKTLQTILVSATLSTEVETLKTIFCRDPAVLDLEEPDAEGEGVTQYVIKCAEDEKFLLTYLMLKLQLIKGKSIVFVADVDRCYRLKLFLGQFGIKSCVLNSELPVNSRINVVEEFNQSIYRIIIASDELEVLGDEDQGGDGEDTTVDHTTNSKENPDADDAQPTSGKSSTEKRQSRKKRKISKKSDYGVSRGIDFQGVACVLNFDFPLSSKSYQHRIGRTARAGQTGMALSFVIPQELYRKHTPTSVESTKNDEKTLAKVIKQQSKRGKEVKDYNFDMKAIEAFRYRASDALRSVTKVAVRSARTSELRQEILNSDKLKRHFEENPGELAHLRHDREIRAGIRAQAHLRNVPEYLLPQGGKKSLSTEEIGFVPLRKADQRNKKSKYFGKGKGKAGHKVGKRKADPLRTFKTKKKAG